MTQHTALEPNPEVAVSLHQHGAVFFHLARGQLFAANRIGADIWRSFEQRQSVEQIAEALCDAYRISPGQARTHTAHFLAQLERQRLIIRRPI
jgi:hypothetical protein